MFCFNAGEDAADVGRAAMSSLRFVARSDEFGDLLEDVGRQTVHGFDRPWNINSNYRRKL